MNISSGMNPSRTILLHRMG